MRRSEGLAGPDREEACRTLRRRSLHRSDHGQKENEFANFQCGHFHQKAILQNEEARDLMKQISKRKREEREGSVGRLPSHSGRFSRKRVFALRDQHSEIGFHPPKSERQVGPRHSSVQHLIDASDSGILSVVFARQYAGRWYARGTAQLQK